MSEYYNPHKTKGLFSPESPDPFVMSRSGIDLFVGCPRCFYLDKRLGTAYPSGFPLSLNNAVDLLLKKEFDIHRAAGSIHPLMEKYGIDAVPFVHEQLDEWRDSLRRGIRYLHQPTNIVLRGGVDDVWKNNKGELHIVDYKATAKNSEVNLDAEWQDGYKRQAEVYQWLFRKNGFPVSNVAYFVYCNGDMDKKTFDGKLEFNIKVIPYEGDDSWVEGTLLKVKECLISDKMPESGEDCSYCKYYEARDGHEMTAGKK